MPALRTAVAEAGWRDPTSRAGFCSSCRRLFGIMLVNFVIIQAAPGGPVDQAIARITGEGVAVTATIAGGGGPGGYRCRPAERLRVLPGHRPRSPEGDRTPVRVRQAGPRSLLQDVGGLLHVRLRRQLLPGRTGGGSGDRSPPGIVVVGRRDVAHRLPGLAAARHRQGGSRRQPLRRLDERGDPGRLCHTRLRSGHAAHRAVLRRRVFRLVSAARIGIRQPFGARSWRCGSSTGSSIWRCRSRRWSSGASRR